MKKLRIFSLAAVISAAMTAPAFGGTWIQDTSRPVNENGLSNWWHQNDDGTYPKDGWYWLDGDHNGVAESYRFDKNGWMFAAATVDGYEVNENGAWTVDGVVQTKNVEKSGREMPLEESGSGQDAALTDEEAYGKIIALQDEYPEGMAWTNSDTFQRGNSIGGGCAGFAYIVQNELYGPGASYETYDHLDRDALRAGDHIRMYNGQGGEHSVVVLAVGDDSITIAEGNYNSSIHWGRKISFDELEADFIYRETVRE